MPKPTLQNIAPDKRDRVVREAARLFAERGYEAADMAALAERCGIAKGSLYNYFTSKDELYRYVCEDGLQRSRAAVWGGVDPSWELFRVLEHTFRAGVEFAREHPELVRLYLSVGTVGLEETVGELSAKVEGPTAERLKALLRDAAAQGRVRAEVDVPLAAWQINNAYVMLLSALVSDHFKVRLRAYLELEGRLTHARIAELCERTLAELRASLASPTPQSRRSP
ncbi:MAG: TetR/AcrR family transcriptional regulator [Deltaproteobacteria bacterium]|nr:TetR/AcrR family transcriptional regulator [Deltaproteobacteria bacterium]